MVLVGRRLKPLKLSPLIFYQYTQELPLSLGTYLVYCVANRYRATYMIIALGGQPTKQSQLSPNQPMHVASLRPLDLNRAITQGMYKWFNFCMHYIWVATDIYYSKGGDSVGVIGVRCQRHRDTILVSSGQGVSVIETWCWCTSLPSECDVGVIGVRCQYHRDAVLVLVLVSLGRGVGVEIVDTQGRSVLVTAHSTPLLLNMPLLNIHKPLPRCVRDAILSTNSDTLHRLRLCCCCAAIWCA